MLALLAFLSIGISYAQDVSSPLLEELFPHHPFDCDPIGETYETEFRFLQDLGRGFVHAEPHRIFFEYYFPAEYWVAFSTADQSIAGTKDQCSLCYFQNYYPLQPNTNHSNLYPNCVEECLDDTIFVATVNSDQENINNWDIIEFQIIAQKSKQLQQTMYRIPPFGEILELWGSEYSPYRENAHFERDIITIATKQYIHARFWRQYDFAPSSDIDEYDSSNEWKPFVIGPYDNSYNLSESDTFCFMSIGSFYGGEYPYSDDASNDMLPGFYIDIQHAANIHCYKRDDIKVDCGQDWSFLTRPKNKDVDTDTDTDTDSNIHPKSNSDVDTDTDTDTYEQDTDVYDTETDIDSNIHAKSNSEFYDQDVDSDTDTYDDADSDTDTEQFGNIHRKTNSDFYDENVETDTDAYDETYDDDAVDVDTEISTDVTDAVTTTTTTEVPETPTTSTFKTTTTTTTTTTVKPKSSILSTSSTSSSTTSTSTTKKKTTSTTSTTMTTTTTLQPRHGEDCCSVISQVSYDNINCLKISKDESIIGSLEQFWKNKKCGRKDHLPTNLMDGITGNDNIKIECSKAWAHLTQIYKICSKYQFNKKMKLYMHFKKEGAFECFNKNDNQCTKQVEKIIEDNDVNFNNFHYDDLLRINVTTFGKSNVPLNNKKDSELAEIEENGKATVSTLAVLSGIIIILVLYILYWFCCSYTSKGYRQSSEFAINNGYCENDIDTEEYDEDKYQLGQNVMKVNKKVKNNKGYKYDVSVHNMDAMPINSGNENMNDAVEVTVNNQNKNAENNKDVQK